MDMASPGLRGPSSTAMQRARVRLGVVGAVVEGVVVVVLVWGAGAVGVGGLGLLRRPLQGKGGDWECCVWMGVERRVRVLRC